MLLRRAATFLVHPWGKLFSVTIETYTPPSQGGFPPSKFPPKDSLDTEVYDLGHTPWSLQYFGVVQTACPSP